MTETTACRPAPADNATCAVTIEDDAPPVVRLIGRTLRDSARIGHAREVLTESVGTVAVRSHDTPQAATVTLGRHCVRVTSGAVAAADATVVVDLNARFAPIQDPAGDAGLAAAVLGALSPPLPQWRDAAVSFWQRARAISGIPDVLTVDVDGQDGARFGAGPNEYLVAGSADALAGVFSGADDLLQSLATGLQVKGTLSQLSVMTAASWKVRYDV